ncbi:MAG: pyruvate kinase alpha/beta domain-containing protein [Syntrophomonadaceae bacterium]|nr:pyruvate kinase alpha/beta domain-containing protein [Syntrophomonadaceae bacterium]
MYWEQTGQINTDNTIKIAAAAAQEHGIDHIVIASNTGATVEALLKNDITGINIVAVTHHYGFSAPGECEMSPAVRTDLIQKGIQVYTGTHLFAGVNRGIRNQFGGVYPAEIMAQTLRMFGQGIKVAVEIAVMALDAGLIPYGEDIISIGGTVKGADSAIIIRPAHSNHIFDTTVKEIIAMPKIKKLK